MTQDHAYLLLLKLVLIGDVAATAAFIADYTRLAAWWKDPIGQTVVMKDLMLLAVIALVASSVFFHFSRLTSRVAAWTELAGLAGIAAVMVWRIFVFEKIHRRRGGHRGDG